MRYKKFTIKGYKAIKKVEVVFNKNQLIPVIGINESGKTSILQAILAFDKSKDKSNKGIHLEYKNKYIVEKGDCSITADIIIESQAEIESILSSIDVNPKDLENVTLSLNKIYQDNQHIELKRNLSEDRKPYVFINTTIPTKYQHRISKVILEKLPFILYFDDFTDRVPKNIDFPNDYLGEESITSKSDAAEWQKLIEEIFKRSTNNAYTLIDFLKIEDEDDREGLLSDVKDALNNEIIEEWKTLKRKGHTSLANDNLDLELKLVHTPYQDGSNSFTFKVSDRESGRSRQFNIVERSKGFQWFFNFILKLKFNSKYKKNPSGAIYLLDEPGSYLHTSAQEELLKELSRISKTNVIFYCTHSQHLLNPDIINVSSIKIASKNEGSIELTEFSAFNHTDNLGALTPLYDALHIREPIDGATYKHSILTEGITDYYFLNMLDEYTNLINLNNTRVIPGAGAANLKDLISLLISIRNPFCVVFDNDDAGRSAINRYTNFFGDEVAQRFIQYGIKDVHTRFELENYFKGDDRDNLLSITGVSVVKSAIVKLYFMESELKENYFSSMSDDFADLLKRVISKITSQLE